MGILIDQGKHTEEERNFEVIESKGEVAKITKIEKSTRFDNSIDLTYKIISDNGYKNRLFWDNVTYDSGSDFAWKYLALRRAAGVPYDKGEPAKLDIEKLLLDRAVTVDLSKRLAKDGNTYQQVGYVRPKETAAKVKEEKPAVDESSDFEDIAEDTDLDWES